MRRYSTLIVWGLASLVSLWWGVRVAFFRVAMQAGSSSSSSSSSESVTMEPAYVPFGIPLLLIIIGIYTLLGFALYIRHYSAFRLVAGAHVVFSLLSLPSVGMLFSPRFWPAPACHYLLLRSTGSTHQQAGAASRCMRRRREPGIMHAAPVAVTLPVASGRPDEIQRGVPLRFLECNPNAHISRRRRRALARLSGTAQATAVSRSAALQPATSTSGPPRPVKRVTPMVTKSISAV